MLAYLNGKFLNEAEAALNISDLSIQRGYGIFDFFRTKNVFPLFLENYLDRFFNSAATLRLSPILSRDELRADIFSLLEKNNLPDSAIRMILTGGYSADSYSPGTPNLIILQQQLQLPSDEDFEKGIAVITHEYQRELPVVKSINYITAVWLQEKIRQKNASDAIYHRSGILSELPRSNLFIVTKDEKIITPANKMLFGITRMKTIDLIMRRRMDFEERDVTLDELMSASEVFLTNTTRRIFPITAVDEKTIGNGKAGKITRLLKNDFIEMEEAFVASLRMETAG